MARQPWQIWRGELQDDVIERIHTIAKSKDFDKASMSKIPKLNERGRRSQLVWLSREYWLRDLLFEYVSEANRRAFDVDVRNCADLQYTEYLASNQGQYGWHTDTHWQNADVYDRKISVTLQLSDEADYEGGDFEFSEVETPKNSKSKGTILIFPSYLSHRVTPVAKGKRYSLVAWFEGPKWR